MTVADIQRPERRRARLPFDAHQSGRRPRLALRPAIVTPLLLLPFAIGGVNALLGAYACFVLGLGIWLLWRPGEPPVLLFVFGYQWLQAALGPVYGNLVGLTPEQIASHPGSDDLAVFLLLTGVLALAAGMRAAAGSNLHRLPHTIAAFVGARSLSYWLRLYVGAWIFGAGCEIVAWQAGGWMQPLLALAQIKWAAFVLLTFATFAVPGRSRVVWLAVFTAEFLFSIGGFFSDFKSVFFYALFGLIACRVRLSPRSILSLAVFGALLLALGIVWTAVKVNYRSYVNGGTGQQIVVVNYGERLTELSRLVNELDGRDIADATDAFARRLMYYEFFGAAIAHVPASIPYADGGIWEEGVTRAVTPRILFPAKRAVNDSDITNRYTGLSVATADQGASISMGFMAEAYVDFGPVVMFAPIAMLGLALGFVYRWLVHQPERLGVIGAALATFVLMPASAAEASVLKVVPAMALCALAALFTLKLLVPLLFPAVTRRPTTVVAWP